MEQLTNEQFVNICDLVLAEWESQMCDYLYAHTNLARNTNRSQEARADNEDMRRELQNALDGAGSLRRQSLPSDEIIGRLQLWYTMRLTNYFTGDWPRIDNPHDLLSSPAQASAALVATGMLAALKWEEGFKVENAYEEVTDDATTARRTESR